MQAKAVRKAFTDFYTSRDHKSIPSASLIPHDDSLLFVNSGMVPFKPYFVGEQVPESKRAVSVQKCVRAGGKHNDLDEVGRTSRHFTFFEMLGNFSFGDYFKEQAISYAWEFITQVLKLDPERLWITVHLTDDEAADIWHNKIGVPLDRIQRLDDDNWWRMADTGPNGPCSEIFWDKGPAFGKDGGPANGDEDRFIEFWNLVFMQFETDQDGNSTPLPKPSIDTGAGLERVVSILQNKDSIFEIDEMAELVKTAETATGYKLGSSEQSDLALRVLAEHSRTMAFLISDGVFPSNEDRGYVLRRIMRRAIRFAYLLGVSDVVTPQLVATVVDIMGDDYPQLVASADLISSVVEREEVQFRKTLATGSKILMDKLEDTPDTEPLAGAVAFMLHDTYGFPYEVTAEVVAEQGRTVDRKGFEKEMAQQREQSKAGRKSASSGSDLGELQTLVDAQTETNFCGRDQTTDVKATVLLASTDEDGLLHLYTDTTPFYAESGGQVGDTGVVAADGFEAEVIDTTYAAPGIVRHVCNVTQGEINKGDSVSLSVHVERRNSIRRNHTATHMLHWALREVLGDHVQQQGSLVAPDRLRFDFSHFDKVSDSQVRQIEDLVNGQVLDNPSCSHKEVTKADAVGMGAIAFFGDKYGDTVRVLQAGPSLEFCGGTHVDALGDIGLVKIISEGSIGTNMRRIEAISGTKVLDSLRVAQDTLAEVSAELNVAPAEILSGVQKRNTELSDLKSANQALQSQVLKQMESDLAAEATDGVLVKRIDGVGRDAIGQLAKNLVANGLETVVLGGEADGGGAVLAAAAGAKSKETAGELIAVGSKAIKGGGGKGKEFAMAGGKNPEGVDEALELAKGLL